jgi:uncharacterized membrane protein YgdD (TMEM256/DUF423 family)
MNKRTLIALGAFLAGITVIIGAFGAHGLEEFLTKTGRADTFETAVKYQMYHSIALVLCGVLLSKSNRRLVSVSAILFLCGIVLFSGSLYLLIGTQQTGIGMVAPIGGLSFVGGWIVLAFAALRDKSEA